MMILALLILLLGLLLAGLLWVVSHDGYGHRPPPRSHPPDPFDTRFLR